MAHNAIHDTLDRPGALVPNRNDGVRSTLLDPVEMIIINFYGFQYVCLSSGDQYSFLELPEYMYYHPNSFFAISDRRETVNLVTAGGSVEQDLILVYSCFIISAASYFISYFISLL